MPETTAATQNKYKLIHAEITELAVCLQKNSDGQTDGFSALYM